MNYKLSEQDNLKNQTINWISTDSKEAFAKHVSKFKKKAPLGEITKYADTINYYTENPIEYTFNNYGFRTPDDFNDTDEGNVFLGESHTQGIGHHLENTWAYKVNKEVGGKFWNLSQHGHGIQTDYRLLYGWKDTLKIKNVFHLASYWPRFEFFKDGNFFKMNSWSKGNDHNKANTHTGDLGCQCGCQYREFYIDVLSDEEYCNYIQETYINSIKGLCNDLGCNYYYIRLEDVHKYQWYRYGQKWYKHVMFHYDLHQDWPGKNDSIQARDFTHFSTDIQNTIYVDFKDLMK